MSYKNLDIWNLSRELVVEIHEMTFNDLPVFENREEGSQIRRSIKSVKSNIVEGYGRREYKQEYIRFMIYAISSNDETIDHLETLFETKSLKNEELFNELHNKLDHLGRMINNFIKTLKKSHNSRE